MLVDKDSRNDQKDGNSNDFSAQGGIGLISSRLLLEGPIKKEKGSFLIGGRSSYAHLFLPLVESVGDNKAYFYDLNTKLSYKLNQNNNIYLSGYFGRDIFDISNLFNVGFGNSVANFRWNHLFSNKLFSNLSLIYSNYDYTLDFGLADFDWNLGIRNFNLKYDFKHYLNEKIKGLENKAKKSGMPYSILKKVYDRGMAAWKGGHRPGTTPQQ